MMIGNLKFKLGNIANDNDFERIDFDSFNLQNNHRSGKCKDCFINRICSGCMGENLLDTGDIYTTSDLKCEMKRLMYEKVIKNLYLLKTKKRE